jgi:50S ribosomal subunit-associated GTPase HflX
VKRILSELKLADIPTILALNKSDLLEAEAVEAAVRQAHQIDNSEIVVISAVKPASLGVLLAKAGAVLARNLNAEPPHESDRQSAALSRIA